jgi:hypothetical protein
MGGEENPGLLPQALSMLFEKIHNLDGEDQSAYSIRGSYLEIYNENVHDLMVAPSLGKREILKVGVKLWLKYWHSNK